MLPTQPRAPAVHKRVRQRPTAITATLPAVKCCLPDRSSCSGADLSTPSFWSLPTMLKEEGLEQRGSRRSRPPLSPRQSFTPLLTENLLSAASATRADPRVARRDPAPRLPPNPRIGGPPAAAATGPSGHQSGSGGGRSLGWGQALVRRWQRRARPPSPQRDRPERRVRTPKGSSQGEAALSVSADGDVASGGSRRL